MSIRIVDILHLIVMPFPIMGKSMATAQGCRGPQAASGTSDSRLTRRSLRKPSSGKRDNARGKEREMISLLHLTGNDPKTQKAVTLRPHPGQLRQSPVLEVCDSELGTAGVPHFSQRGGRHFENPWARKPRRVKNPKKFPFLLCLKRLRVVAKKAIDLFPYAFATRDQTWQ